MGKYLPAVQAQSSDHWGFKGAVIEEAMAMARHSDFERDRGRKRLS